MTPELSRRMGRFLGTHIITMPQRKRINLALEKVDKYEDLPKDIKNLIESAPTVQGTLRKLIK